MTTKPTAADWIARDHCVVQHPGGGGGEHTLVLSHGEGARLARHRVWSRVFPYSSVWLRLGLPAPDRWPQLEAAL